MKRLILLAALFSCTLLTFAQHTAEVVYLKNGSIIKGNLIEAVPNESVKIQTIDGSIFVYKMSEVSKIVRQATQAVQVVQPVQQVVQPVQQVVQPVQTVQVARESVNRSNKYIDNNKELKSGFRFFSEAGYTFGDKDCGRLEVLTSGGYQINPYLYLGVGLGWNYYTDADASMMPFYGNVRAYIPIENAIHPYIDIKPGYSIGLTNSEDKGFYIGATAGIEVSNFTVGIGYSSQTLNCKIYDEGNYYNYHISSGGFTIKIGVTL